MYQHYEQAISDGRAITRKQGVTLQFFKDTIKIVLITNKSLEDNYWVQLYVEYVECKSALFFEVNEWLQKTFAGYNIQQHDIQLKDNTQH